MCYVIKNFEPGTSPLDKRIEAAVKVAKAGYPLGFIVMFCIKQMIDVVKFSHESELSQFALSEMFNGSF
jgi:DNA repair photolyase